MARTQQYCRQREWKNSQEIQGADRDRRRLHNTMSVLHCGALKSGKGGRGDAGRDCRIGVCRGSVAGWRSSDTWGDGAQVFRCRMKTRGRLGARRLRARIARWVRKPFRRVETLAGLLNCRATNPFRTAMRFWRRSRKDAAKYSNYATAADCRSTLECLRKLGVEIDATRERVRITGQRSRRAEGAEARARRGKFRQHDADAFRRAGGSEIYFHHYGRQLAAQTADAARGRAAAANGRGNSRARRRSGAA